MCEDAAHHPASARIDGLAAAGRSLPSAWDAAYHGTILGAGRVSVLKNRPRSCPTAGHMVNGQLLRTCR